MAKQYSLNHTRHEIKWANPTHTRIASIQFGFQIAGDEVTKHTVTELYPELLKQLKDSKAFSQLTNSDNLEIHVKDPDTTGTIEFSLVVKNTPYAPMGNAQKTALDAITRVFNTRFSPKP